MYSLHYHFVFITKYRKPVLVGDIGTEVRNLFVRFVGRSTLRFCKAMCGRNMSTCC